MRFKFDAPGRYPVFVNGRNQVVLSNGAHIEPVVKYATRIKKRPHRRSRNTA